VSYQTVRSTCPHRPALGALVLLLCIPSSTTLAAGTLWGRSSTYLGGYVKPADTEEATYMPFMETVELHTKRLGVDGLSLHTGFWGLVDLMDRQDRYRATGDLTMLYLDYRVPSSGRLRFLDGLRFTAGRQFVALGPTVLEQLDGGKLHYLHRSGLELGLFGGVPTGTRFTDQAWSVDADSYDYGYNWVVGGRLGYVNLGWLAGGSSFVHRVYNDEVADNDLGFDLSYTPLSMIEIAGEGTLSLEAGRLKQVAARAAVHPHPSLSVNLGYRYASPDLWIPRVSIFAVFSEETYQEAHLDLRWRATRRLALDGSYGRRFYSQSDVADGQGGNRASLRAVYRLGNGGPGRAVGEVERLESPDNAANRVRLALALPVYLLRRTFRFIVETDLTVLDEPMRDERLAFNGGAFLEAPLIPSLSLLAGGSGGFSPLLKQAGSFIVRLNWDFGWFGGDAVEVRRGGGV